jgi:hypothetical protein
MSVLHLMVLNRQDHLVRLPPILLSHLDSPIYTGGYERKVRYKSRRSVFRSFATRRLNVEMTSSQYATYGSK